MCGRKKKYITEEERIEKRREQNRNNQRKCRIKKGFLIKSNEFSKEQINQIYIENIINHFSKYDYDYHFVGTSSIGNHTMNSLYNYTKKKIEELQKNDSIERSIFFIEGGNGIHYHYHILIKSKEVFNINKYWKIGILKTIKIVDEIHKINLFKYVMKDLKNNSKSIIELKKNEYWDFYGDY